MIHNFATTVIHRYFMYIIYGTFRYDTCTYTCICNKYLVNRMWQVMKLLHDIKPCDTTNQATRRSCAETESWKWSQYTTCLSLLEYLPHCTEQPSVRTDEAGIFRYGQQKAFLAMTSPPVRNEVQYDTRCGIQNILVEAVWWFNLAGLNHRLYDFNCWCHVFLCSPPSVCCCAKVMLLLDRRH